MLTFGDDSFEQLATEIAFCLENIRHPDCTLEFAGRFYENAAEALRAHAILRVLIDGNESGFCTDLIMSGQCRRGYLRRCAQVRYADHFFAFSRSSSFLDALASDDIALAIEIFEMSASDWRRGDEYEVDFCYQRLLGLCLVDASAGELEANLGRFDKAAEGGDPRLQICRVLFQKDDAAFGQAFQHLLSQRAKENEDDQRLAEEDLPLALGTKIFIEGIAVLKVARRLGFSIAMEYPMCPYLALTPRQPVSPPDEFASP